MNQKRALKQLKQLQTIERRKGMRLAAEGWTKQWQTLIAIMLSARTRDEVAVVAAKKLFKRFPTLQKMAASSIADIRICVGSVNFFRNKSKSVLGCAQTLVRDFKGIVPSTLEKLITLPGVGRKTANVFMSQYGTDAIGVDTHVAYISRFLGWTKQSTPEKIENDLTKLFPQNRWSAINTACVAFGKTHLSRRVKDELLSQIKEVR